jgi:hypothetical protein
MCLGIPFGHPAMAPDFFIFSKKVKIVVAYCCIYRIQAELMRYASGLLGFGESLLFRIEGKEIREQYSLTV